MTAISNIPSVGKTPYLLRLFQFIAQPIEYVENYAKLYGDTFYIPGKNDTPIVYFSTPEALQQIFTAAPQQFESGRGNLGLKFLLGVNSLILLDGERHQRQRQLLAPPFHGERMRAYGDIIREITQKISKNWQLNKPFNIRASMQEISLRVILRVVFGLDEGQHLEELRDKITSLLDFMGSPLMSAALFLRFMQTDLGGWSPWGRVLRLKARIDELIDELIQERRAESDQNRQDILSLLISARDANGEGMTNDELRDELMTLLLAGHETTASGLTWAFYWLDMLPDVREKLCGELDTLSDMSDVSAIAKLPYLTAVCQESLRIYPIVMTSFLRILKSPMEITGYKLPAGSLIIPSIYLAHHREEVYPQSKQFKPERFLERQFSPYEYLPFGGGNRRCIGMAFAMYEMKLVLATILSQFQLSLVNKRPVRPVRRGLTLAAPSGMRMIVKSEVKS
ncbi:MAG: cytochrome P450 [Calothrix sp. MO_167.B12]|nr:cytochrome P450 [Calothrix sp. MO_167.B12]